MIPTLSFKYNQLIENEEEKEMLETEEEEESKKKKKLKITKKKAKAIDTSNWKQQQLDVKRGKILMTPSKFTDNLTKTQRIVPKIKPIYKGSVKRKIEYLTDSGAEEEQKRSKIIKRAEQKSKEQKKKKKGKEEER